MEKFSKYTGPIDPQDWSQETQYVLVHSDLFFKIICSLFSLCLIQELVEYEKVADKVTITQKDILHEMCIIKLSWYSRTVDIIEGNIDM